MYSLMKLGDVDEESLNFLLSHLNVIGLLHVSLQCCCAFETVGISIE